MVVFVVKNRNGLDFGIFSNEKAANECANFLSQDNPDKFYVVQIPVEDKFVF